MKTIVDTEDMFTFVCAVTLQGFVNVPPSLIRNIAGVDKYQYGGCPWFSKVDQLINNS
jgi:hypothetical protein